LAIETRDSQSRQLRYSSGCSAYFLACFALDGSSLSQTLSLKARSTLEPFSGSVSFALLFCGSVLPLSSSASDAEEGPRGRRWWEQNGRAGRKPFDSSDRESLECSPGTSPARCHRFSLDGCTEYHRGDCLSGGSSHSRFCRRISLPRLHSATVPGSLWKHEY
jgi:hypothetical protein